jgi:prepilin-type N-terminal cleavage/methylation domain-containing protein
MMNMKVATARVARASCPSRGAPRAESPCHVARRSGFTLIELLVVITIILLVSAVALPTVLPALSHRQVSEAARILQAALVGARDAAIRDNAPSGIRLLPDPALSGLNAGGVLDNTLPLAYNRVVPIGIPPDYQEGLVSVVPANAVFNANGNNLYTFLAVFVGGPPNVLVLEQSPGTWQLSGTAFTYVPNPPTSWFWNIRVGDKVQINNAGPWYTVIGPLSVNPANTTAGQTGQNPELFVNVGMPGTPTPLTYTITAPDNSTTTVINPEYLLLVNGQDDNANGWVDEEWDGVDNNNNGLIDGLDPNFEWIETEKWLGSLATRGVQNALYTIQRRPTPTINAREVSLPSDVVIDATSWGASAAWNGLPERTRVPISALNVYSGVIDILVNPDGSFVPTTIYSSPSSFGMGASFCHFWLAERSDVVAPATNSITARPPRLPIAQGLFPTLFSGGTELKGEFRVVTLFTRTGQIVTFDNPQFDPTFATSISNGTYNTSYPFLQAQQGVSGGQ